MLRFEKSKLITYFLILITCRQFFKLDVLINIVTDKTKSDNFQLMDKIVTQHFSEIEHNVPHFQQILFDLQNEYYKIWKNSINSNLLLFKEYMSNSDFDPSLSPSANSILSDIHDEATKYRDMCNKIGVSFIESNKKNAKTWNENVKIINEVNKKIMNFWIPSSNLKTDKNN